MNNVPDTAVRVAYDVTGCLALKVQLPSASLVTGYVDNPFVHCGVAITDTVASLVTVIGVASVLSRENVPLNGFF